MPIYQRVQQSHILCTICTCFFLLAPSLVSAQTKNVDTVFQYSAINALLAGVYDGDLTLANLAEHGDTGLGTINGIDGELIVLDGQFYSIKADGLAYKLAPEVKTPFAVVAFLNPELEFELKEIPNIADLEKSLNKRIRARNAIQIIRVDGTFSRLKVRSEPKQTPPYRPLVEVMSEQQVNFELKNVKGTMVGFRMPDYMTGLNVPGYHFHFITEDRKRGGHVLNLKMSAGNLKMSTLRQFSMDVPDTSQFNDAVLGSDREHELRSVEKN